MEIQEYIEKIVKQSKNKRVKEELDNIVGSIMADVEDWPAWYLGLFDWEEDYDFSEKKPTSTQRENIDALKSGLVSFVKSYEVEGVDAEDAALSIAQRAIYWEDWYWDEAENWAASSDAQDREHDLDIYSSPYGLGIE